MLKREDAQAALKEFRVADWEARRVKELEALPTMLGAWGEALLRVNGSSLKDVDKAIAALEHWPADTQRQLFQIAFPGISKYVYKTYSSLLLTLPYQSSYARRAFRSANPAHYSERRKQWLRTLLFITRGYEQPVEWYAAWAPHVHHQADALGLLFAMAINEGGDVGTQVFEILCESARGEHETGGMGRHVTRGLLVANRPEGWQLMENMLVAAQRQEGLRQVILETIDEAHPEAFARMPRVIGEQNMVRFSATVRAADTWFGLGWDVDQRRQVQESLEQTLALFEQPEQVKVAIESDEAQQVFLGLWRLAYEDVEKAILPGSGSAIAAAESLLKDDRAEHRFVAIYLLRQLNIPETQNLLLPYLEDPHMRVAAEAFFAVSYAENAGESDRFERLETFLSRVPEKEVAIEPLVWPWMSAQLSQRRVGEALKRALGYRPVQRMIPYLSVMDIWPRSRIGTDLVKAQPWDDETKAAVFELVGDRSSTVRESVLRSLKEHYTPEPAESPQLEALLTRKAADLRRGILSLLLKQSDANALKSAERLLQAKKAPQRLAGLELLEQLQQNERANGQQLAESYIEQHAKRSASEQELLDKLLANKQNIPTLNDALGLAPLPMRSLITPPQRPQQPVTLVSEATQRLLTDLDALILAHRTTPITVHYPNKTEETLLGNLSWLPYYNLKLSKEENIQKFPLAKVWLGWWVNRSDALRDGDGLELLRAIAACTQRSYTQYHIQRTHNLGFQRPDWIVHFTGQWFTEKEALESKQISSILDWLDAVLSPERTAKETDKQTEEQQKIDFLLDAAEFTLAELADVKHSQPFEWRNTDLTGWLTLARHRHLPQQWREDQIHRLWRLLRWYEAPDLPTLPHWKATGDIYNSYQPVTDGSGNVQHMRPSLQEITAAFAVGAATEADVCSYLTGASGVRTRFSELQLLTRRKTAPDLIACPALVPIVNRCRDRILHIELTRGELPTAATGPALALSSISGIPNLIKLLQNFGTEKFARGWLRDSQSKASSFSHLFRASFPAADDTPTAFAQQAKAAKIPEKRLVEIAVYAPQWAQYVENVLGWKELTEAVWWFHAHTKDNAWQVDREIRELWTAQIAERTPLSSEDLVNGAVDVAWFQRIYKKLTPKRWAQLDQAAKYASGGGGHKRAQLFADTMTGKTKRTDLLKRIQDKRHQDTVRALGLLPLAKGKKREADLLKRYEAIQEFVRTSRKFGAQRKASEKLAARIGMENLARTAGYLDPQRLAWAMEKVAIADLATGPVTLTFDTVIISLAITEKGDPELTTLNKGKPLKNIPAKLRKDTKVKALQARKQSITRQASRIRHSLENAMCRGDEFTGSELKQLLTHPILRPSLNRLIFIDENGQCGYPINNNLVNHDGAQTPINESMALRIAHPVDLASAGEWHLWQQHCFTQEQIQPFKQIFRELYVPTLAEQQGQQQQGQLKGSVRYAGHQVNPRQSVALLNQRNWIAHPYDGIRRPIHDENIDVSIEFEEGWYTPSEVEGFTLDTICFVHRQTHRAMDIADVPPRLFSEVMRDLDLVVSVAHQGGVDPEASASTVEMRTALLRETCHLLKLNNIRLQEPYALIEGQLGSYTLHLGSATVHRQPGGSLCIIPVHSQHRGRLFLPFADSDPKTAEVMSKALLLAQDHKIQDPTILEQLR